MKVDVPSKYVDLPKIVIILEERVAELEKKGRQILDAGEAEASENPEESRETAGSKRGNKQRSAPKKQSALAINNEEEFPSMG